MPVHVDELVSEVSADTPVATEAPAPTPEYQELARARELHAQLLRDHLRTAAEGFDD